MAVISAEVEQQEKKRDELKKLSHVAEMMFVASLYTDMSLMNDYHIKVSHFIKGGPARMFYNILLGMKKKQYDSVNQTDIETYVQSLGEKAISTYRNYGGYQTILSFIEAVDKKNVLTYYSDVKRYSALRRLRMAGFDVESKWEDLSKLSYGELNQFMESTMSDVFDEFDDSNNKVEDLKHGMREMVEKIQTRQYQGLPVNSHCLNSVINGMALGNITMVAGMSGVGKTFVTSSLVIPTIIKENIPILIICNEEDADTWRWDIVVWIANNIIASRYDEFAGQKVEKIGRFGDGLNKKELAMVNKAIEWYEEHLEDGVLNFVNLETFSADQAIALIRKYAIKYGVKYFILDTFKLDNDIGSKVTDNSWLQLQQNVVRIYNVIKESNLNVHLWITYQLSKTPKKYLDQSVLGMSKNVADVVSTLILVRNVTEREKSEGKMKVMGPNGVEKVLNPDNDYMVFFIDKNRRGTTSKQVVIETDKGLNIIRDVGFTTIYEEF